MEIVSWAVPSLSPVQKVTEVEPAGLAEAQEKVPLVLSATGVNVAPEGRPVAHRLVMASPSVAATLTTNDKVLETGTDLLPMAARMGGEPSGPPLLVAVSITLSM